MRAGKPPQGTAGAAPGRPFPNTYWVRPGRLLAGEYPGATSRRETGARLKRLLGAGINAFIDLTREDELPAYASQLTLLAPAASHQRFPIVDHGLPEEAGVVSAALDTIDAALAAGQNVYVHCRAGVGRTGTVVGCWLMRHGLQSHAALDLLAELWQQSERSRMIPQIPETAAQTRYVHLWREGKQGIRGAIPGVLCGMALAEAAGGDIPGAWGCHTAMTLLLAESLLAASGNDPEDQMQRYLRWQHEGRIAGSTLAVPLPVEVRRALASWQWTRKPYAGSHDPANRDAHTLARTAAVALYFRHQPDALLDAAADASRTSQQAPVVLDACRVYAALLAAALDGTQKHSLLRFAGHPAMDALHQRSLKPEIEAVVKCDWQAGTPRAFREDAVGTLSTALHAFGRSADFGSGIARLREVSASRDAAAIYGALAGAHYGAESLPAAPLRDLADRGLLDALAERLANHQGGQPA